MPNGRVAEVLVAMPSTKLSGIVVLDVSNRYEYPESSDPPRSVESVQDISTVVLLEITDGSCDKEETTTSVGGIESEAGIRANDTSIV